MKRKMKRFLGILLSLALMLGLMPGMSLTAYAATQYNLRIGGEQVTSDNLSGEGWSFAPESNTLTLNGFSYTGDCPTAVIWCNFTYPPFGANTMDSLTVTIEGTNSITHTSSTGNSCGIAIQEGTADLTIQGTGTLSVSCAGTNSYCIRGNSGNVSIQGVTITGQASSTRSGFVCGIEAKNTLTIGEGANVNVTSTGGLSDTGGLKGESVVIANNVGSVVSTGSNAAIKCGTSGTFQTNISGKGWTDQAGTTGGAAIGTSADYDAVKNFKHVKLPYTSVTGINLDKTTAQTVTVGDTVSFNATVAPENASDKTVMWSVGGTNADAVTLYSDETCNTPVTLDTATDTLTVYAKGVEAGSATVSVTSNDDNTKVESCNVTVNPVTYTVTYKVVNGTWSDDTTENKTETVQSGSKPASVPSGMKASEGYTGGTWDTDPADATITGATTFTYTFAAKSKETTPTAAFTATGADTGTLSGVSAGMKYSLDGAATWTDITGSADISLTGLSAGSIQVVKKGNGTTTIDSDPQTITVTKAETPNLTVTQPTVIDGKGTVATTTAHEYSSDNGSTWTACTANQEFEAGSYLIRVKASGTALASGNQSVTITAFVPGKETTPSATFTATGADTGTLSGAADGMKYKIGEADWTDITGSDDISLTGLSAGTIQVVKKGNGTTTVDSDPQTITVTKAETPNLTVTQPTVIDGKGTVATTTAHEYSSDNGSTWTACTANQEFAAGSYLIRVKASGTALASGNQTVTIKAFISATVTFKVVNGSWNEGDGDAATADKTVTLTGYEGDTLKLTAAQIPAVGTKPNDTYKAGSWNVTPSAETEITEATTYTYTYVEKEASVVTKAPEAKTLTYNGSAQELVTAGTATGGEMQYALGTVTEATQPYTTSIPAKTDAGTYYVWYKVVGDSTHTDTEPVSITVTIKNKPSTPNTPYTPSTPGAPAAEAYTVPVSNENTVDISANISEGNAVVQEITQADLDKITDDTSGSGSDGDKKTDDTKISVDVSGAKSEVTSVELSSTSIETLAKTVEANEKVDSVEIKMTNATVELDSAAVSAISEQKEGNTIKLVVENKEQAKLNETQKESLKSFTSVKPFQAYFESGGKEIHDFKGGKATVSIKFSPEAGRDAKYYHVYYVPLSGLIERYVTRYLNGWFSYTTSHFSDYAIVYDATMENETGKEDVTPSPSPDVIPTASPAPSASASPSQAPSGEKTGPVTAQEQAQAALDINAGLKVIHNGTSASVQWSKVDGAKYYKVYAAYCGSKYKMIKTVDAAAKCKVTIKKLNGKKLSTTKNIKVYVAAYRTVETKNGETVTKKDVRIAKTIAGHVVGKKNKKYSNAKKIKLSKTSYTLKKGKKAKIMAKTVLQYPKRKQLGDAHAKEFRYASSDKSIATVSKSGKITAKKKGSCVIYVYARNGLAKKVKVTVK